jgi:hypothetical protein
MKLSTGNLGDEDFKFNLTDFSKNLAAIMNSWVFIKRKK